MSWPAALGSTLSLSEQLGHVELGLLSLTTTHASDDVPLQVCIILEGSVTLSLETHRGKVKVVDLLPQEFVCCGVVLQRAELCTATSSSRSKLLMIPEATFKDFLNPAVLVVPCVSFLWYNLE